MNATFWTGTPQARYRGAAPEAGGRVRRGLALRDLISPRAASLLVAAGAAFALAAAWYFQLVVGLAPCPLCLEQRIAYYVAVPVALLAFALASRHGGITRLILLVLGGLLLANAGLATYHAGIEWHWWPGPTACSGTPPAQIGGSILEALKTAHVPRCDEAPWRLLDLSMAGWNTLIALGLAAIAALGATVRRNGA